MADPAPVAPPAAPGAPPLSAPPPAWHTGVEADFLGTWQNRGIDYSDPEAAPADVDLILDWYRSVRGSDIGVAAE